MAASLHMVKAIKTQAAFIDQGFPRDGFHIGIELRGEAGFMRVDLCDSSV
jgi:hypothetical protein